MFKQSKLYNNCKDPYNKLIEIFRDLLHAPIKKDCLARLLLTNQKLKMNIKMAL